MTVTSGTPRVSVILCAHNAQRYIQFSIESILAQLFSDLEVIVVDDGSTDGTADIVSECGRRDRRVVPIFNGTNKGIVHSRNRGLEKAQGDLIAGQDADDLSLPARLQRQVEFLAAHRHVGVVGTWARFIDEDGQDMKEPGLTPPTENEALQDQLIDSSCFCCPSVVVRRELLTVTGPYDPRLPYSHDYELLLRLAELTEVGNLDETLYLYRRHGDAVTARHRPLQMLYKAQALQWALARRWGDHPPPKYREILCRDFVRASYLAFAYGDKGRAISAYEQATRTDPDVERVGSVIEDVISRYVLRPQRIGDLDVVSSFFEHVLGQSRHLKRARNRLESALHMDVGFVAAKKGEWATVSEHLWPAVRGNPWRLLNRDVASMALRYSVGWRRKRSET